MKKFECKSLGMDCQFTAQGDKEDEVLNKAETHAISAHNLPRNESTKAKIREAIVDM